MEWIPVFLGAFKGIILLIGMVYAIKWHYDQDRKASDAGDVLQSPTEMRFFATMIIACALSVIGVAYAGCWGNPADGGRGGALACALAFFMCFMARPDAQASKVGEGRVPADPASLVDGAAHEALLSARMESAWREKVYLGVASGVGALTWKFGAAAAAWLSFSG